MKKQLEQFGQTAHLGFAWRMLNETPALAQPPWDFLSFTTDPPLTEAELAAYLPTLAQQPAHRWIELAPLPRDEYTLNVRAADLVHRMVSAKRHGANAIFVPDPFDPQRGLMNEDGTPSELLLPGEPRRWRWGGAQYSGSMTLAEGSENHVFSAMARL